MHGLIQKYLRVLVSLAGILSALNANGFSLGRDRLEIAVPVGGMHAPLQVDILGLPEGLGPDGINIVSNVEWVHGYFDPTSETMIVSVDVPEIPKAYAGQIMVQVGESSVNLAVSAVRLDAVSNIRFQAGSGPEDTLLLYRGKGVTQPFGNLFEYFGMAHMQEGISTCVTLPGNPIDFALSSDRSLVYVIDSVNYQIQEFKVSDMTPGRTFDLPVEDGTCCGELSEAFIEAGDDRYVYFTDGELYAALHVYDLTTESIVQNLSTGRAGFGFGDFGLSTDGESLIALGRVIRGASGEFPIYLSRYEVQEDGSLVLEEDTFSDSHPKSYFYPAYGPKLVAPGEGSDWFAFGNNLFLVDDLSATKFSLPKELNAISPGGFYALSHNEIFSLQTGKKAFDLPIGTPYATFLNDVHKVAFVPSDQIKVQSLPFVEEVVDRFLEQDRFPEHGAVVQHIPQLRWGTVPSASAYFLYLSRDVDNLDLSLISQTTESFFDPGKELTEPGNYYWRVDAAIPELDEGELIQSIHQGALHQLKVLPFGIDQDSLEVRVLIGMDQQTSRLHVDAPAAVDWSVKTNQDWIQLDQSQRSGTADVQVTFIPDWSVRATQLQGEILFYHQEELVYEMPVTLYLDRLFFRRMLTIDNSPYVFGLATTLFPDTKYRALLAKINTFTGSIDSLVDVGPHATDFEIHSEDGKLYVAHGVEGSLSVFNLQTLEYERKIMLLGSQHPDRPGHAFIYLSAGPPGYMMVEDTMGPTIASLIATDTGRSLQVLNLQHRTGAFSPVRDTYYSAESVGLERRLNRFQFGDRTLNLVSSVNRNNPDTSKGERMMISENGQRIFWDRTVHDADLQVLQELKDNVYAISSDGKMAFGLSQVYDADTGKVIKATTGSPLGKPFPESRAYHSETDTLVFQDQKYQLYFERIIGDRPGSPRQDEKFSMEDGISWPPAPFASQYHVYLSQDKGGLSKLQGRGLTRF